MRTHHSTLILIALSTAPALADDAPPRGKSLAIDGGIAAPTGDFGELAGFGIGALARFEMPLQPALTLTVRAGYIQHLAKEAETGFGDASTSVSQVPLLGGVRYAFSQTPTTQVYGGAELGLVMFRVSTEIGEMSQSNSDTNLGLTLGGGYRTGKLDLRAGLMFPDIGELGDAIAIMATVGYDIAAL